MPNSSRSVPAGLSLLLLIAVSSFGTPVSAHEIDLGLNSDAFRITYATRVSDGLRLDGGWLRDSDKGDVVHVGLLVVGEASPKNNQLTAGLGFRLAYLDGEGGNQEGYAVGVGGSLRWPIPGYDRFALSGDVYWAPDLLSGGDAEKYVDSSIRASYSVTRQAEVYVGARYTGADYEDRPSVRFDTGLHAGLNLRF